jgi:hypothetical protein
MAEPTSNERSTLFGFLNSTVGKVTLVITFVTTVFTAFRLFVGDSRLAIIVMFAVGTGMLFIASVYVLLKKNEIRTATFKHGLKVNKEFAYPKHQRMAAVAILLVVAGTWGVAVFYKKLTPFGEIRGIDILAGKTVTIEGFVLTAGGEPADNALVTLFLNGKLLERKAAADGKFSFSDLDPSQFGTGEIVFTAKLGNLEAKLPINPSTDQLSNLIIKLPPGPPPFSVEYFILEGPAIDFLLQGKIETRWAKKLGGDTPIAGNDVFNDLKKLINNFSSPFQYEQFEISNSESQSRETIYDQQTGSKSQNRPFFLGGSKDHPLDRDLSRDEFAELLNPEEKWHLIVTPERGLTAKRPRVLPDITAESFFFWRFATSDDVKMVLQTEYLNDRKEADFYRYITSEYLPPDFFIFSMQSSSSSGGCIPATRVSLESRSLKLRIAVLENTSEKPIRIGKFSIKQNNLNRLRSRDENESMLSAHEFEQKGYFTPDVLKPNEKFVIPIELLLANGADEDLNEPRYTRATPSKVLNALSKVDRVDLPVVTTEGEEWEGRPDQQVTVSTSVLMNMIRSPGENPNLKKEFVFGSSQKIESVEVDGITYPFRPLDTSVLVMSGGFMGASCPYIFTFSTEDNLWINEGTILTDLNGKWKESTYEKELTRFDGSILIRERDPETSYIDKLYIRAINHDGTETILTPKNNKLGRVDQNYLVLRQGEQERIDFVFPPELGGRKFILGAKGYYIPYAK